MIIYVQLILSLNSAESRTLFYNSVHHLNAITHKMFFKIYSNNLILINRDFLEVDTGLRIKYFLKNWHSDKIINVNFHKLEFRSETFISFVIFGWRNWNLLIERLKNKNKNSLTGHKSANFYSGSLVKLNVKCFKKRKSKTLF